ncbi:hypothetical protein [Bradyrhizobium sp. 930_D9_N1_4]|uniref:hypothetical protein n=1 Tax=Bradyrhizobium sp. 930_D9_N1_4 TaxID=3240374 RepID=UPI003F8B0EDB
MAAFLNVCRYTPTAGSTTDWTFSAAVTGYQSPTAAGVVNGRLYKYRAESSDLSQWEIGEGAYNTGTGVLARTTVLFNSSGTTSKINFSAAPQVAIVALKEDLLSVEEANAFTAGQKTQARSNIGAPLGDDSAFTSYSPSVTASVGSPTTVSATGRYKQVGKIVFVQFHVTVTTVGTAAGQMLVTLPAVSVSTYYYTGAVYHSGNNKSGAFTVVPGSTNGVTYDATGTTWWASGATLEGSVFYEVP